MVFCIKGRARVSDYTNPVAYNVYSRYEHVYSTFNVQPSFGWITMGISASTNL